MAAVGFSLAVWGGYEVKQQGQGLFQVASLAGSIASFFGFLITLLQVLRARGASEKAQEAAETTRSQIYNFVSAAEVSRANQTIGGIQSLLRDRKYEAAWVKMKILKDTLIQFKGHEALKKIGKSEDIDILINEISIGITNIHNQISGSKKSYNIEKLVDVLEATSSVLSEFESKLKYQ
jgi:hypothetical protein